MRGVPWRKGVGKRHDMEFYHISEHTRNKQNKRKRKVHDMNPEILENKTATALISAVKQINEKTCQKSGGTLHLGYSNTNLSH